MGFLTMRQESARITKILLCVLSLSFSGCTISFSANHVTTIPLIIMEEVPIPDSAKKRGAETTIAKDAAISLWCMGAEGWESDVLANLMSDPGVLQSRDAYFEGTMEQIFITLIGISYEQAELTGKWVKMVSKEPAPFSAPAGQVMPGAQIDNSDTTP